MEQTPDSILVIGAGVFGLSTALSLLDNPQYNKTEITILDSSPTLPNPNGSSVDSSRIIRADYASRPYARLAAQAQEFWRDTTPSGWGGEGRYHETGFVLTADPGKEDYVHGAMAVVKDLAQSGLPLDLNKIEQLPNAAAIQRATGHGGVSGELGYANWNSGWADADKCVAFALKKLSSHPNANHRVTLRPGTKVSRLTFSSNNRCTGVELADSSHLTADITILATGAWTPSLLNLENRAIATGQVLGYMRITPEEQAHLGPRPVVMNLSQGTFLIPPRDQELKIARHGFGYRNPEPVVLSDAASTSSPTPISVPRTDCSIPSEAHDALRVALRSYFPPSSGSDISTRPFTHTRLCWYTDTPTGDFLITYHPSHSSLLLATGGSGHGFKFLPVIGEKIVLAMEGRLEKEWSEIWRWRSDEELGLGKGETFVQCEDGSRAGPRGMVLEDELKKGDGGNGAVAAKL